MHASITKVITNDARGIASALFMAVVLVGSLALPGVAVAQNLGGADTKVTSFFTNINSLLNIASISVVTIAVIFAGYQIAFAHKRISDVAPILIGGFLIGAAGQVARMLLGNETTGTGGMAFLMSSMIGLYA